MGTATWHTDIGVSAVLRSLRWGVGRRLDCRTLRSAMLGVSSSALLRGSFDARVARQSNPRFERSRGRVFGGPRRESMIEINQLRFASAHPRVAQPDR